MFRHLLIPLALILVLSGCAVGTPAPTAPTTPFVTATPEALPPATTVPVATRLPVTTPLAIATSTPAVLPPVQSTVTPGPQPPATAIPPVHTPIGTYGPGPYGPGYPGPGPYGYPGPGYPMPGPRHGPGMGGYPYMRLSAQQQVITLTMAEDITLGQYLVDQDGYALYVWVPGSAGPSSCEGDCLIVWLPATTTLLPAAGPGVNPAMIGAIARDGGTFQVTYNRYPLHYFAGDPGGQSDVGGWDAAWYCVTPNGKPITR